MEREGLSFVRILIELICLVVLLGLITFIGSLTRKWEIQEEIFRADKRFIGNALELSDIANPKKEYTPSEVAEIIITYGDKYTYVVDSLKDGVKKEHLIERDSEEHERARLEAQNLLNSGRLKGVYGTKGDQFTFVDDFMWSADYLQKDICYLGTDTNQLEYTVKIQIKDPVEQDRWIEYGAGDTECYPENMLRQQFRIHYTLNQT